MLYCRRRSFRMRESRCILLRYQDNITSRVVNKPRACTVAEKPSHPHQQLEARTEARSNIFPLIYPNTPTFHVSNPFHRVVGYIFGFSHTTSFNSRHSSFWRTRNITRSTPGLICAGLCAITAQIKSHLPSLSASIARTVSHHNTLADHS
jgi:hypothetical protein